MIEAVIDHIQKCGFQVTVLSQHTIEIRKNVNGRPYFIIWRASPLDLQSGYDHMIDTVDLKMHIIDATIKEDERVKSKRDNAS